MIKIALAGATGWTGRALVRGILQANDLALVSAVSRSAAGRDLGTVLGGAASGIPVFATAAEALAGVDVLVDYTSHEVVKANALAAIDKGVSVVVGSSGLTADDFPEIDAKARLHGVAVIAAGNFSLTAALAQAAALMVARFLPAWEIIDYASSTKPDVPSGTSRELADRLARVRTPHVDLPVDTLSGPKEARGVAVGGTQIHSVRSPGFVLSTEVIFGLPDERLTIRHDAGGTPEPYVAGTLAAVRATPGRIGLTRGLDTLLLETAAG